MLSLKDRAVHQHGGKWDVFESPLHQLIQFAAAGLDVLEEEPPDAANPLLSMDNVLVTPHTAFYSDEAFAASRQRIGEEISAVLSGKRPRNCVNREVLDRTNLK